MAKNLYEILEVSASASPEAIRAAYERLSTKFDPYAPENQGKAEVRMHHDAITEAFLTLGDPMKRRRYDQSQAAEPEYHSSVDEAAESFWTLPKFIILAVVLLVGGGGYYQHKQAEARLAAERAIAEAKAREAEAKAQAEAQAAAQALAEQNAARRLERERAYQEARTRREFEQNRRNFENEQRRRENAERYAEERKASQQRMEAQRREFERQRSETTAVYEARQRAAREREELCRIERERYGKSISC